MRFQRNSNGDTFVLSPSDLVGSGGEARVYVVPPESRYVAKVYHRPTETQVRKLRVMVENPPEDPAREQGHISIAWPLDLVTLAYGERRFAGYLMPRVVETRPLFRVYNPGVRRRGARHVDYVYLHRIARNLSAAVRALHARGYVIGDINESNILVTSSALITLVDTDSFQVRDPHSGVTYRCPVGKPEYTPPELQGKRFIHIDRAPEHDRFGLAVLIFQLLMEGAHPYAGLYGGAGEPPPYEERIAHGWFSFGSRSGPIRPMPAAPGFELLSPELRGLFLRCFEDGFSDPAARPDAQIWQSALASAERALVCCARNPMHLYGSHLSACPWCERKELLGGRDPFPALDARDDGPMRRVGAASLLPATPAFGGYSAGRSAGAFVPAPAIASGGAAVMSWQSAQPLSASAGPAGAIALPTPTLFSMKLEGGGWAGIALFWAALAVCAAPLGLAGLNLLMALLSAACAAAGWMLGAKGPKAARWTCALSACAAFASIAMRPPEPPMLTAVAPLVAGRGAVRSLDFSPDGARLAAGTARVEDSSLTEGALDIWDIAGSRLLLTPERSSGDVVSVAFAPNGSFLVAGTDSPFGTGEVTLVNATATGAYNSVVKLRSYIRRVAWSPDGRLLAAAGDDRIVRVFDSATLQLAQSLPLSGNATALAFSPDGSLLAVGSEAAEGSVEPGTVAVWATATGTRLWTGPAHGNGVQAVVFSPNGRALATAGNDGAICLWDPRAGRLVQRQTAHSYGIAALAFSPDGAQLASAESCHTDTGVVNQIVLRDGATAAPRRMLAAVQSEITALAYSPRGGLLASGGADGAIRLWRAAGP